MIDQFYTSRFNRDPAYPLLEGEDINNSKKRRIYSKKELKELAPIFMDFLVWVLLDCNVSKITFSEDLILWRESKLPSIKLANTVSMLNLKRFGMDVQPGEYFITLGKYKWHLMFRNELYDRLRQSMLFDPEFIAKREELTKIVEERNANVHKKREDESSE